MLKTCSKCQKEKPESEFYRTSGRRCKVCQNIACIANVKANPEANRARANKWYHKKPENRQHSIDTTREWQRKNPERDKLTKRRYWLKKLYGISLEQYQEMYDAQEGKCKICSRWFETLHVDHDHSTGKIRSLLCNNHNTGLGLFQEDPALLQEAVSYLESHKQSLISHDPAAQTKP